MTASAGSAASNSSDGAMTVKCQRRQPARMASPQQPPVLKLVYRRPFSEHV